MITINNENHKNLKSNVPFEGLPRWFQDAKTEDAVIVFRNSIFNWYMGTWKNGVWHGDVWFDGEWENGKWHYGKWYEGTWHSGNWIDGEWENGLWINGIWDGGEWMDGTWKMGEWYNGVWLSGTWCDGLWEDGSWYDGVWEKGIWIKGIWKGGVWLDGYKKTFSCKLELYYNSNTKKISIGCKEKTVEEWDKWFEGDEIYVTKRDTEEFKNIYKAYLITKYTMEIENK